MALKGSSSIVLNVEKFIKDVENRPAIWNRNYHCNKPFLEQMWEELSTIHQLPKFVLKAKWKGLRDNFRVEYKRIPRKNSGEFVIQPAQYESKWIHYYALLFLTDHMRHRLPKMDQDEAIFYFNQFGSEECEQTIVVPDLSNGLTRIPDSDEEFDEDDVDDDDIEYPPKIQINKTPEFNNKKPTPPHQPVLNNNLSEHNGVGYDKKSTMSNFPSIRVKKQRLSEDSNFNGSSTMESCSVAEDDDYHYLLSLHPYMKQLNSAQKLRIRTKIQKLIFKELYKEDIEESK